ncbi:MAG: sugar diacid recognition domain-containing protein [Betaproteobacteria bacterium]
MIGIEPKLAQEIVERTMKIIPFNINVMNTRGIIIGSGEPSRIGTVHDGALLVLSQHCALEIDAVATRRLQGVKPGVNLPLTVRGQICGVVGLTGHPSAVRQFGELVRITAEMILEQSQLINELQREKRYREEFVFQLVKQESTSRSDLEAWATRLGIDFSSPRSVVVLQLTDETRPDMAMADLHRCQAQLLMHYPDMLVTTISPSELVFLDRLDTTGNKPPGPASVRQHLSALNLIIRKTLKSPSAISLGVALAGIENVALSYQSARKTYRVGRVRNPEETVFSFYDLSLPVLLSSLDSGWQADWLRQPIQRLKWFDKNKGTLRRTIEVWFAQNKHPVATAKALKIHRNTLDYRLRQISELTGLDLNNTDDCMMLYIALQLE